jgi:hypothetical protein
MPKPIARFITTIAIGIVKLTAAKLVVPNSPMKNVSTKLKKKTATMPITMGKVNLYKTRLTGAETISSLKDSPLYS